MKWEVGSFSHKLTLFFFKPVESPPAGHQKEYKVKTLHHQLHFSHLEAPPTDFYSQWSWRLINNNVSCSYINIFWTFDKTLHHFFSSLVSDYRCWSAVTVCSRLINSPPHMNSLMFFVCHQQNFFTRFSSGFCFRQFPLISSSNNSSSSTGTIRGEL